MPPVHWLKIEGGKPYAGAFRRPRDWREDGSPITEFVDTRGRPVRERVPAIGADGSDIRHMKVIRGVRRFVDYLRDDGNIAPVVMTNAAAHVPNEDTSYAQDRRLKARYFGWVEWPNRCPCALHAVGEITLQMLNARCNKGPATTPEERKEEADAFAAWRGAATPPGASWWGAACHPGTYGGERGPCIHLLAERRVRRALRSKETADREERFKSEEARAAERQTAAIQQLADRLAPSAPQGVNKR